MTIDERTQQILAQSIGMVLIANARLQAEAEAWDAKVKAAEAASAGVDRLEGGVTQSDADGTPHAVGV